MIERLLLISIQILLIDTIYGASYNQPIFSPCAKWNSTGITFANQNIIGSNPITVFIDRSNTIYLASRQETSVDVWLYGNASEHRTIFSNLATPVSVFVTIAGDIFVGLESTNGIVLKGSLNTSSSSVVLNAAGTCYGLFLDSNNTLYCSREGENQVVKISLNINGANSSVAAGIGVPGNGSNMLNHPRGLFVDSNFNLYVADEYNNRIQLFKPGQLNGTTVVGYGAEEAGRNITIQNPTALAFDGNNFMFILQWDPPRIIGEGPDGFRCLVACNNSAGSAPDQLNFPRTFAFDIYGNMFVADRDNNRVQKFLLASNYCNSTETTSTESTIPSTMITTDETQTTFASSIPSLHIFYPPVCNNPDRIGTACNITATPCDMLKPCQNNGICINNKTNLTGYYCHCLSGFNGTQCQFDIRPCKPNTCWNNGTCVNISDSEFECKCAEGWTNTHCQTKVNYCENVTCENNAVCRPLFRDYRCECLSSSYSGRHCEIVASTLVARKVVARLLGYIAIISILSVILFVVVMDVLKYIFHIDPVCNERERLHRVKLQKKKKKRKPVVAIRYQYVNAPPIESNTNLL